MTPSKIWQVPHISLVETVMPHQTGCIPSALHMNASISPQEGSFHIWDSCVREDISMIKSTFCPQDQPSYQPLPLSDSKPGLLLNKGWFVRHPQVLSPLHLGCYLHILSKAHTAFASGQLFEPLTINISVSQTINNLHTKCFLINGKLISTLFLFSVFCVI